MFLQSIYHRPDFARSLVEILCLNASVSLDVATQILTLCCCIKSLNMLFPCHVLSKNPVLEPLEALTHIKVLHVNLLSIFNTPDLYLPNVSIFHRVTHLHLANAWASWYPAGNTIGLQDLVQITHLSTYLSTTRTPPYLLRKILDRKNLMVLVLWKRSDITPDCVAAHFLEDGGIQDDRILVLDASLLRHHMLDEGFWACAERVVKSREGHKGMYKKHT